MLKNRKLQHIGFSVNDIEKTTDWYVNVLGFEVVNEATTPDGKVPIKFIKNGTTVYELYQPEQPLDEQIAKKIDHLCYDSQNIEEDYDFCVKAGYTITTQGIEQLETVWENGVRYFKIAGPSGEEVEFCQIL